MGRKLYVGNLPHSANNQTLQDTFSPCGTVESVNVIMDRATSQNKGFAFVEMSNDREAQTAIRELNGFSLDGREIKVNEAKPKVPRGDRHGRGYGGAGHGYGGGGGRSHRGYGGGDRGNR